MAQITLDVTAEIPADFIITKSVVIIEGYDGDDDELQLWTTTSPDVKGWQTLGMLEAFVAVGEGGSRGVVPRAERR